MHSKFEPVVRFINFFDGNLSKAATALSVANPTLSEWRDKERPVPVKKAVLMERVSQRAVKRQEFFPLDAAEIWPELHSEPGTPAAAASRPALYLRSDGTLTAGERAGDLAQAQAG